MRIGCCCNIEEASIALAAGFDFIECKVTSLLPEENGDAVSAMLAQHKAAPLPVAALNVFLPGALKIVGPEVDAGRIGRYVDNALARVQEIGSEIIVFGSGVARAIPDGFPAEEARKQIIAFLHRVADAAEDTGVTVVIEPLNRKESNVIHSVAEGVSLAEAVNRPNIQVLADFYHMDEEQEPLAQILEYQKWIKHIHVADTGRRAPGSGHYPYAEFADTLRQARYERMVSIECRWEDFQAEAAPALEFLRRTLG
ncbi:MAG: sugar phosphate isomerase/epimerase [Caldilineaceae bacterium]|nr:sugar phosphate isomerase/epimerase [Caldilineaceae bacterium]